MFIYIYIFICFYMSIYISTKIGIFWYTLIYMYIHIYIYWIINTYISCIYVFICADWLGHMGNAWTHLCSRTALEFTCINVYIYAYLYFVVCVRSWIRTFWCRLIRILNRYRKAYICIHTYIHIHAYMCLMFYTFVYRQLYKHTYIYICF